MCKFTRTAAGPRTQLARETLRAFGVEDPRQLEKLLSLGSILSVPAGWAPLGEGTPGDGAYLLLRGEVSLRRGGVEFQRLGGGDLFGEAAAAGGLRNATVVALTDLLVLRLPRDAWVASLRSSPAWAEAVQRVSASRLR